MINFTPEAFIEGQIVLIDKPIGWTSHDVIGKIRGPLKKFCRDKKMKIGHAGTLDPLATGLLIILTGKFTKQTELFQNLDKAYSGTITLGGITASFDAETEVTEHRSIENINAEKILTAAKKFSGAMEQMPPQYSSVKIGGVRAYQYARQGDIADLKFRNVVIHDFEIMGIELPLVHFKIHCSKGTYIRSLAHDFGQELGCGGYLSSLRRTAIGDYIVKHALSIEYFLENLASRELPESTNS